MIAPTHYIYCIQPMRVEMLTSTPTPEEGEAIHRHFEYLKDLTEKGIAVLAGRTLTADERTFGIVVIEAATEDEARTIMTNDPAVKHGVMYAELFPFRISMLREKQA